MATDPRYSVDARLAALAAGESEIRHARQRYNELRRVYETRFSETYNPVDDRIQEVYAERQQAEAKHQQWKSDWFKDYHRSSMIFTFWAFAILLAFGLLSVLFQCVIMKWC